MTVSIVIPMYGRWAMTHKRLQDINYNCFSHLPELEVVVVDDASSEDHTKQIKFWSKGSHLENFIYYKAKKNKGFGGNSNLGLRIASGDLKILISTDVMSHFDYVSAVISAFSEDTNQLVGARLLDQNTGWNKFDDRIFPYLEGWFLAGTSDFWKENKFDKRYGRFDYEDVDLSTQAIKAGYKLTQMTYPPGGFLHLVGQTIDSDVGREARMVHTEKNRDIFRQKWIEK